MTISLKTRVLVWGRAGTLCSKCRRPLVKSATEADDAALVGECAHMVAEQDSGPRGDASVPVEQRNRYDNLLLLCGSCHKEVDDQPNTFTLGALQAMKAVHERAVASQLDKLATQRRDDLAIYADYVEEWGRRVGIDDWSKWTYGLMSPPPQVTKVKFAELEEAARWLFGRVWPKTQPDLEHAFDNFRHVLADLIRVFDEHKEERWGDTFVTRSFYKIPEWDKEKYDRLSGEHSRHVDLLDDLVLELTRAANRICDEVRLVLDSDYRRAEGLLLAKSGPYGFDFSNQLHRAEYGDELGRTEYPGLKAFKEESLRNHAEPIPDPWEEPEEDGDAR